MKPTNKRTESHNAEFVDFYASSKKENTDCFSFIRSLVVFAAQLAFAAFSSPLADLDRLYRIYALDSSSSKNSSFYLEWLIVANYVISLLSPSPQTTTDCITFPSSLHSFFDAVAQDVVSSSLRSMNSIDKKENRDVANVVRDNCARSEGEEGKKNNNGNRIELPRRLKIKAPGVRFSDPLYSLLLLNRLKRHLLHFAMREDGVAMCAPGGVVVKTQKKEEGGKGKMEKEESSKGAEGVGSKGSVDGNVFVKILDEMLLGEVGDEKAMMEKGLRVAKSIDHLRWLKRQRKVWRERAMGKSHSDR
jgi:hypothetical protein